ncbi:nuclease s1 [Colletotrichum kahawae]|uniref:Nuclease s1 n=1 Tax=Colletotrichum kahawae TaxID=34407 RepID=A0AAD9YRC0_COLKA|nr:nuclease s1 [Colletotrichum kahawae]
MRLSTALLACAVPSVLPWGNVGHRTVGYLAEKYPTDEAAALVGKLLANDRNYDISYAATWADTLRGHMGWASKYHYISEQRQITVSDIFTPNILPFQRLRHLRHAAAGVNATAGQCVDLATGTCALGWATESNAFVCSHVLKPGRQWLKANDLSEGYYDQTWEVVDEVIGRAGVRLGAWLNAVAAKLASETGPVFEEL